MQSGTDQTLAVIEDFNEAFGRADVDAIMALMTDDCVFESTSPAPDGQAYVGQRDVRRYWERFFSETVSPEFAAEEIFGSGGRAVCRWRFTWGKESAKGHVRGVDILRVRDGKVAEKLSYVKG